MVITNQYYDNSFIGQSQDKKMKNQILTPLRRRAYDEVNSFIMIDNPYRTVKSN